MRERLVVVGRAVGQACGRACPVTVVTEPSVGPSDSRSSWTCLHAGKSGSVRLTRTGDLRISDVAVNRSRCPEASCLVPGTHTVSMPTLQAGIDAKVGPAILPVAEVGVVDRPYASRSACSSASAASGKTRRGVIDDRSMSRGQVIDGDRDIRPAALIRVGIGNTEVHRRHRSPRFPAVMAGIGPRQCRRRRPGCRSCRPDVGLPRSLDTASSPLLSIWISFRFRPPVSVANRRMAAPP
jgi:hypothetical protein